MKKLSNQNKLYFNEMFPKIIRKNSAMQGHIKAGQQRIL